VSAIQFANSIFGVLSALVSLILGIRILLPDIRKLINRLARKEAVSMRDTQWAQRWTTYVGVILVVFSASVFLVRAFAGEQVPLNVELTSGAWDALNGREYVKAIALADSCVSEFSGMAEIEQAKLDSLKVPVPPEGSVTQEVKQEILSRGILNDVATCLFIKGRALEALNRKDEARKAYSAALSLPYARCWDPKGWFWSPAKAAQGRLRILER
jgi:hypothetical protein